GDKFAGDKVIGEKLTGEKLIHFHAGPEKSSPVFLQTWRKLHLELNYYVKWSLSLNRSSAAKVLGVSHAGVTPCNRVSAKLLFASYLEKGLISVILLLHKFMPRMSTFHCTSSFDNNY
ncbi:unnamed protein product, partial [Ixodes persulcatus]